MNMEYYTLIYTQGDGASSGNHYPKSLGIVERDHCARPDMLTTFVVSCTNQCNDCLGRQYS